MITWIKTVRPDGSLHPSTGMFGDSHPCGPGFIGPEEIDHLFPGNTAKIQTGPYDWTVTIPDSAKWAEDNRESVARYHREMARGIA